MIGPLFEPSSLAPPDSLAGALMDGRGPVHLPGLRELDDLERRPARLGTDAFGTTSDELRDKLGRVLGGEGFVVSTGQQPVLFLGPLYVVYKALTAIELAAGLEARLGVPVVPVFWIASDDHDWDEIGQATLLDRNLDPHTLRLEAPAGAEGRPAGPTPLGQQVDTLLHQMSQLLTPSEFTPHYLEHLKRAYSAEATVAQGFAGALRTALGDADFAWLDAAHPEVKTASRPFFTTMLDDAPGVLAALDAGEQLLREGGFEPPIAPVEGGLPLFYDDGHRRQRVLSAGDGTFAAGRDGTADGAGVWAARLEAEPDRFSPSVSSRPALESWLMPVAATVLGPGEIAYWSQLIPVFEHLGARFPTVAPRASFTAIEPRVEKTLRRMDLRVQDLEDGGAAVMARVTAESRPGEVDRTISELRTSIGDGTNAVTAAIATELPGLKSAAGKAGKALHDAVSELDRQVDSAVRVRQEAVLSRVRRAAAVLWPRRARQERVLNPFHFLAQYGGVFVETARRDVGEYVARFLAGPSDDS